MSDTMATQSIGETLLANAFFGATIGGVGTFISGDFDFSHIIVDSFAGALAGLVGPQIVSAIMIDSSAGLLTKSIAITSAAWPTGVVIYGGTKGVNEFIDYLEDELWE